MKLKLAFLIPMICIILSFKPSDYIGKSLDSITKEIGIEADFKYEESRTEVCLKFKVYGWGKQLIAVSSINDKIIEVIQFENVEEYKRFLKIQ